ncbi:sulfite exporter TauE/SafE family protein [Catelliglobosispora koreensis]|uniref:sulfite exporter TauE/SafE family protein n=1 Tax=Catelliglobosispora koreensis TaxID=129052 RepID=UPI00036AF558|nr:sulfite exporter TauE/SafE family protein [Catelliglobosispora koreensis]
MSTSLISVLLLGLLAGGVSCAAVQGGLLAGLVSRQQPTPATAVSGKRPRARKGTPPAPPASFGDDLAPVGGFLAGKLVSHTLLGALLGLAGTAVQLSAHIRAMVQLGAGVLIIVMGLGQLGVRGFTGLVFTPPASWTRLVRGRARSQSALAPAVLGVSSILIPCGVTLSVMALAVASGSPWQGALILAVFVIGTAPLFTLLGYAAARARRTQGPWRQRLAVATGLVVLTLGAYTFNGGLELTGSPLAASQLASTLGLTGDDAAAANTPETRERVTVADGKQTVIVTATEGSYAPGELDVAAGLPTTLIVRSQKAQGCIRSFVIPSLGVEKILPVNGDTSIDLGILKPGRLAYSCGMGMYTGKLTVTTKAAS